MKIQVTFRHIEPSEKLKEYANEKVGKLKKYFQEPASAHVVYSVDRNQQQTEINISAHGMHIFAKDISGDMYQSLEGALKKVEGQVRKYHEKLVSHRAREGKGVKMRHKFLNSSAEVEAHAWDSKITETSELEIRPMMVDEALMQMDLLHQDFLIFSNAKTHNINILQRKENDQYRLLETVE